MLKDCEFIVEGFHYCISDEYVTVYRGGAKRFRIRKTRKVLALLESLQDHAYGKAKTTVVVNYIMKHGVPCGTPKKENDNGN